MSGYGHAGIGSPSALARTVQCAASVAICKPYPVQQTEETLEGDVADWVAQQFDAGKILDVGAQSPVKNGPLVTQEMITGAVLWRDKTRCEGGYVQIPVSCHPIHPMAWGTPDKFHWDGRILTNWDYKFGRVLHDPFEHWQSIGYLIGELAMFDLLGKPDTVCRAVIIQPRDYRNKVKVWETTCGALRAYLNIAQAAIEESLRADARARTGEECLYCTGRHTCETLRKACNSIVRFAGSNDAVISDPNAIGAELEMVQDALKLLDARATGLEQQAVSNWFKGRNTPGYIAKQSLGNRKWKFASSVVHTAIMAQHKIDLHTAEELPIATPAKAEEMGVPETTVERFTSRAHGEWKLVRDDGKEARKAFGAKRK